MIHKIPVELARVAVLIRSQCMPSYKWVIALKALAAFNLATAATCFANEDDFFGSVGAYSGIYSMTSQVELPDFTDSFIAAATGSVTLWKPETLPISFEAEGMVGFRFGQETNAEIGISPLVVRWEYFPWNEHLYTNFRIGVAGLSYLAQESDLENTGLGASQLQSFEFLELTFARPEDKSLELFLRHHHRCTFYETMDDKHSNGSDYLTIGIRKRF